MQRNGPSHQLKRPLRTLSQRYLLCSPRIVEEVQPESTFGTPLFEVSVITDSFRHLNNFEAPQTQLESRNLSGKVMVRVKYEEVWLRLGKQRSPKQLSRTFPERPSFLRGPTFP